MKNMLDSETKRPMLFSDLTGEERPGTREDLTATLRFVREVDELMRRAKNPGVSEYIAHHAIRAVCWHMGWLPYEVGAAEQYMALSGDTQVPSITG